MTVEQHTFTSNIGSLMIRSFTKTYGNIWIVAEVGGSSGIPKPSHLKRYESHNQSALGVTWGKAVSRFSDRGDGLSEWRAKPVPNLAERCTTFVFIVEVGC